MFAPLDKVGFIPHWCKGCRLLRTFGERQMVAQPIARRLLISSLINKGFRECHPLLASGNFASGTLNHQKCARARMSWRALPTHPPPPLQVGGAGKEVGTWLAKHPRFVVHFTPVHGSWINQVEHWFSILQRKRLRIADFASKDHLGAKLEPFIHEWNPQAHPFHWSTISVAKIMAEAPTLAA